MRQKIGECLVHAGLITDDDLRAALAEQGRTGEPLGVVLARMNLATDQEIAETIAFQLGFPYVDLVRDPPDPSAMRLIPRDLSVAAACVGIARDEGLLTVAMADPLDFSAVRDVENQCGYRLRPVVSTRSEILDAIRAGHAGDTPAVALRPAGAAPPDSVDGQRERGDPGAILDLIDRVLQTAISSDASDIHIDPGETGIHVRYRVDGLLKDAMELPGSVHAALIAQLKSMAGMDVAETRLPQAGRIRWRSDTGTAADLRVSTLATLRGEKMVMRALDRRRAAPALEDLGMSAAALGGLRELLKRRQGMILVVGPACSGRTTTLCAAVSAARSETVDITTIEDPPEYRIAGVNQIEIDESIALTSAAVLRSVLQQDPDVIMVGDLRDSETTALAMRAAQDGRFVLSSCQGADAASGVTRLMDAGIEPVTIASGLAGVVAQRLVRRLCVHCRRPWVPAPDVLRSLGVSEADTSMAFYKAAGCDQCNHTGYRGRTGVFEVLRVTEPLRRLMVARAPENQIRDQAVAGGMVTLGEAGLAKVGSGVTTVEELTRVVPDLHETRTLCAACGAAVGVDFNACPSCGRRLVAGCPHCGRGIQPGWTFCPYCAQRTDAGTRKNAASPPRTGT